MKALIVDDHNLFRDGLAQLLQRNLADCEITHAASVADAAAVLADDEKDLVLLDLFMPDARGVEGLKRLRAIVPDVPIVIVSASEAALDIDAAIAAGAAGYIPKSVSAPAFTDAVTGIVERGEVWLPESHRQATARGAGTGLPALTARQVEVLRWLADGKSNREIGQALGISEGTVKIHVSSLMRTLGVRNRAEAVRRYLEQATPAT